MVVQYMNQKPESLDSRVSNRDSSIDILRAIAFIGIVSAHMDPSDFILQLRSFDVPMMVFISGVVCQKTYKHSYVSYVFKRFVRIILPTWIFLVLYYWVIMHFSVVSTISQLSLMTGWYVWIMRVFFIIALFAPLLNIVLNKISVVKYFALLSVFLIVNEVICRQTWVQGTNADTNVIIVMNLAYLLVFSFGYMINCMSKKNILSVFFVMLLLYGFIAVELWFKNGYYVLSNVVKYPPRIYYLSYALVWICTLWLLRGHLYSLSYRLNLTGFFAFIGSHTMWMYFWHIIVLHYCGTIENPFHLFIVVFVTTLLITYVQHMIVMFIVSHIPIHTGKYLRVVFDG